MKCKMCGAELKKDGELCSNCINKIMQDERLRSDTTKLYEFKRSFVLGYQLSKHIESIIIAIVAVIMLIVCTAATYFTETIMFIVLVIICETILFLYDKYKINRSSCSFYTTKLVYEKVNFINKTKVEIKYEDVKEFSFTQSRFEKLFNIGTIYIKTSSRNLLERNIFIESVKDVQKVFNDVKEKIGGE